MKRLISLFLILAALSVRAFATVSANTVWEVETGGVDTNGGGFVTGASGTDFSQQAAAQFTLTTATSAGAGSIILEAQAATTMVGNILHITGGPNFIVGWYQITAVSAGVSITVDRPCTSGVGSSGAGKIGGAFATPAGAHAAMILSGSATGVGGNICYIKSGTYTQTTTWTVTLAQNICINFVGYNTTRTLVNTDATRPLLTTATNAVSLITTTAAEAVIWRNLTFTTTAGTKAIALAGVGGVSGDTAPLRFVNCKWSTAFPGIQSTGNGGTTIQHIVYSGCEMTGTSTFAIALASNSLPVVEMYGCNIHACAGGITSTGGVNNILVLDHCLIVDNTDRGIYINTSTSGGIAYCSISNCTIANNTTANFEAATTTGALGAVSLRNNIFYGSAATLKMVTAGLDLDLVAINNAFGGGGATTNYTTGQGDITLSGDPFTSAGTGDYSLNNTAARGALLRGTGYPQTLPAGTTTSRMDVGASQHTESASSQQVSYTY